jgi:hypothetical protein
VLATVLATDFAHRYFITQGLPSSHEYLVSQLRKWDSSHVRRGRHWQQMLERLLKGKGVGVMFWMKG